MQHPLTLEKLPHGGYAWKCGCGATGQPTPPDDTKRNARADWHAHATTPRVNDAREQAHSIEEFVNDTLDALNEETISDVRRAELTAAFETAYCQLAALKGMYCACGQDEVTCQSCGRHTCANIGTRINGKNFCPSCAWNAPAEETIGLGRDVPGPANF